MIVFNKLIEVKIVGAEPTVFSLKLKTSLADKSVCFRRLFVLSFVSSALSKIITTGFKALQLQYFFTAGKDEVKAWTILVSMSLLFCV